MHNAKVGDIRVRILDPNIENLFDALFARCFLDSQGTHFNPAENDIARTQRFRKTPLLRRIRLERTLPRLSVDGSKNPFQIRAHVIRGEAKHGQPQVFHVRVSFPVIGLRFLRLEMLRPVDLHHQAAFATVEVGDIRADGMLPAELHAHLIAAKTTPHREFRRTHGLTHRACALEMMARNTAPLSRGREVFHPALGQHQMIFGQGK